jgi:MoxR-like ATPase
MAKRGKETPKWWVLPADLPEGDLLLPPPFFERYKDAKEYDPGIALESAINIALILGQPLLLTGEPGSGKTSVAYWLAYRLGHSEPLVQIVKSTTSGKDLLYTFDELARFRDAQSRDEAERATPQHKYLELSALGLAILFSGEGDDQLGTPRPRLGDVVAKPLRRSDLYRKTYPDRRRHVVLIDELDKAPSDTPNDLLSEIERMEFLIPELSVKVSGDPGFRPVIIVTSNSEKSLPDAFLRRCVYHHIPPPNRQRRAEIVDRRRPKLADRPELFANAMATFEEIHGGMARGRKPGTAEMLAWLDAIEAVYPRSVTKLRDDLERLGVTLKFLGKSEEDLTEILRILDLKPDLLGFD